MEVDEGNASPSALALPQGWTLRPLFELVRPATGQVSPLQEPYASMTLVAPDHIESETGRLIAKRSAADQGAISGKYLFKAGDVVYSKIRPYLRKAFLADFDGLCSADMYPLSPRGETDPRFVLATLLGHAFSAFAESASARSGIPKINRDELAEFRVAVPPPNEQRAIASALSHVDALLAKLDQLIAKKRDLKQAAMQQLLTGRTRLPGFSDPWREQAIGEMAEIVSGATPRTGVREYWDGGIPWCTPTDITASTAKFLKETDRTLTAAGLAACSARLLPAGALLLCTRATVGEVKIAAMPVCTNQGFKSLVCRGDLHNEYLYYQLLTMKPRMLAKASGSTFPELSRAETAALQLPVPSLGEQRAIAQVLADIDDELVVLEARRDKTRQLKQGMMQALLTGRIRLA